MSKTPEGESRTVSLTGQQATDGPTPPKAEMKKPQLKSCFMSPTDAMMSPCTQKLLGPKKGHRKPATGTHKILISNKKPSSQLESSHLAEKENEHKAALKKITEESDVSSPNKLDS
ncbi:hypothetical protein EMCRGX_G008947 [Ephydatia muelleri]|eukprot:Em0003g291a